MQNASLTDNVEWDEDGLHFRELCRQEYEVNNCVFSAGEITRHPIDTVYLRWQKDGDSGGMLMLTPDELQAITWVASGALFSVLLAERLEKEKP